MFFPRWAILTYCRTTPRCRLPPFRLWLSSTCVFWLTSLLPYWYCLTSLTSRSFQVQLLLYALQMPSETFLASPLCRGLPTRLCPAVKIHHISAPHLHTPVLQQTSVPPPKPQGLAGRANVLKTDLLAGLNSSPPRHCWGRRNSIGHPLAPDEAGCPQQCAFQHDLLAYRTSHAGSPRHDPSPCLLEEDHGRGTTGGSSRAPHLAGAAGEVQHIFNSPLIVVLAWLLNNWGFSQWILPSWNFFMVRFKASSGCEWN